MSVQKFLDKIKNGRYGADITDAIIGGIKKCYDDASVNHDNANMEVKMARGTHNTLNDRLDKSDEIQAQTNAQLSANKQELGNRIDNIVANNNSTDGNSELIDVRIGYDGFNYGSAGSAVRAQINSVDYDINDLKNSLSLKRINLFDNKNLLVNKFAKNESDSTINDFGDRENTVTSGQIFKVKKGDKINTNLDLILYYLYDANGIFIERLTDGAREHIIQNENAFYMRLVYNNYNDSKIKQLVMTINEDEFPQEFVPYTEVSITTKETANFEKRITDLEKLCHIPRFL